MNECLVLTLTGIAGVFGVNVAFTVKLRRGTPQFVLDVFADLFHLTATGTVNTPNLKQHQSRNIKPPVYTQQVSYHSMNHVVVHGYTH